MVSGGSEAKVQRDGQATGRRHESCAGWAIWGFAGERRLVFGTTAAGSDLSWGIEDAEAGLRKDGPWMRMVMPWCWRRSSNQQVQEGVDQGLVREEFIPGGRVQVGGDDGRGPPIAGVHQAEEGVGLFGFQGQVIEFVNCG